MSNKDMDINRLKKENETDKTKLLELTKKFEEVERVNNQKDFFGRAFQCL